MMSPSYIRQIAREAAETAAEQGQEPFVYFNAEEAIHDSVRIPFLGDYVPEGWETIGDPLFVDSSGFGSASEPALTREQYRAAVAERIETARSEGYTSGFAVVEAGQFQVYVQEYRQL